MIHTVFFFIYSCKRCFQITTLIMLQAICTTQVKKRVEKRFKEKKKQIRLPKICFKGI